MIAASYLVWVTFFFTVFSYIQKILILIPSRFVDSTLLLFIYTSSRDSISYCKICNIKVIYSHWASQKKREEEEKDWFWCLFKKKSFIEPIGRPPQSTYYWMAKVIHHNCYKHLAYALAQKIKSYFDRQKYASKLNLTVFSLLF